MLNLNYQLWYPAQIDLKKTFYVDDDLQKANSFPKITL